MTRRLTTATFASFLLSAALIPLAVEGEATRANGGTEDNDDRRAGNLRRGLGIVGESSSSSSSGATTTTTTTRQLFEHQELFKFPFDEKFFYQPRRSSIDRFSNSRNLQQQQMREKEEGKDHPQQDEGEVELGTPIDLDFRFNKFNFAGNWTPSFMPLGTNDYPIEGSIAITLKTQSDAVSVVCEGDAALPFPDTSENMTTHREMVERYIAEIGGMPTMPRHPNAGHLELDDDEFWDEFRHVAQLQFGRRQNIHPGTILRKPNLWLKSRNNIDAVAEAVHDEYPGSLQVELIEWLWKQKVKPDYDILPFRSNSDFVGLQVTMADLNTWSIGAVAPINFYVKWYAGRPRPEEVAYAITTKQMTTAKDGVPPDVVQLIDLMKLQSPEEFTAYPEGSPRHPAWPAMHSAASSASFWLAVLLDLTPAQYCEALRVDYAVAFARTCAGVHYATDNIAGLNLGQAIIADKLPDHLASHYGSDPMKVRDKINKLRFDWNNFDSYTCAGAPKLA